MHENTLASPATKYSHLLHRFFVGQWGMDAIALFVNVKQCAHKVDLDCHFKIKRPSQHPEKALEVA